MPEFLQPLLDWMVSHPNLTAVFVFLTAFFESLILIGILIPGALLMFGLGALVSMGHISLAYLLIFGSLGAITGDCLSFWLGRHFKDHLLEMWPFSRYPIMIEKGDDFIRSHGGKGVFMARFIGPIRPIVPAVAGILNMPIGRFLAIDIVAGILWTPAYVLPGAAFGASLNLASEVAMRLVILLMAGLATLWLLQWICKQAVCFIHQYSAQARFTLQEWGQRHTYLSKPVKAIVDPDHPEVKGILTLAVLLLVISWGALIALISAVDSTELIRFSEHIHQLLLQLKIPATDYLMLLIQELSSPLVHFSVFISIAIWLAWRRHWLPLAHWVAAISFGLLLAASLRWLIATEFMKLHLIDTGINPPSSQISDMVTVLGFFTVLIAHSMSLKHRWIPYTLIAFWIVSSIIAKLYLGTIGILGVIGGLAFSLAWVILIGTAYRTHIQKPLPIKGLVNIFIVSWIIAGTWSLQLNWKNNLLALNPPQTKIQMTNDVWHSDGWKSLPLTRIDFAEKKGERLTIQWAGDISAIRSQLLEKGWQPTLPLTLTNSLFWLSSSSQNVPLPPRAHAGNYEALVLMKNSQKTNVVLRLWPTQTLLLHDEMIKPLWVGNISTYRITHPLPILSIPETIELNQNPLSFFLPFAPDTKISKDHRAIILIN